MRKVKMWYHPKVQHPWHNNVEVQALEIETRTPETLDHCIYSLPDWEVWIKGTRDDNTPAAYLIRELP